VSGTVVREAPKEVERQLQPSLWNDWRWRPARDAENMLLAKYGVAQLDLRDAPPIDWEYYDQFI